MPINTAWHEENKIQRNTSIDDRIKWHVEHQIYCKCRPIPQRIKEIIKIR